jgi:polyhydroxyalkanoate synthesis regulator phasin
MGGNVKDELRRMATFGSGMVELTKSRAEQIVKDLVKEGEVRRKQASSVVKDLMETSRANRKELGRFVRAEMKNQVESLGLATKRDFERLERRVTRLESNLKEASAGGAGKSPARKTAAREATRKSTAKKPSARKTAAKKPSARRTSAAPSHSPSPINPPAQPPGSGA